MATHNIKEWMEVQKKSTSDQVKNRFDYNDQEKAIIQSFTNAIHERKSTISLLLEDLSTYIKNEEDLIGVCRALKLLYAVVESVRNIPEDDLCLLIDYLIKRISNEENNPTNNVGIRETVLLFKALSESDTFKPDNASLIINGIFTLADERHRFKDLPEIERQNTYTVVDHFYRKHSDDIIQNSESSRCVDGLLELAIFEKKASCLLIVFSLISHLSQSWNLGNSDLEKMFKSFIRYFPIKISGLQNESLRIGKEMSNCLTDCIVSNDYYALLAFPYFIDKLNDQADMTASSSHEIFTVVDSCVRRYSVDTVAVWSSGLWNCLKHLIWNNEKEDYIQDSLIIIRSIADSLGCNESHNGQIQEKNYLAQYVIGISNDCRGRIVDSPQKYLPSTGKIIYSIASSSIHALHLMVKIILPLLLALWKSMTLKSEKKMLLDTIAFILKALVQLFDNKDVTPDANTVAAIKELAIFQEGLVEILSNAVVDLKRMVIEFSNVKEHNIKDAFHFMPALESLALLFRIPSYLTRVEQGMIVQELIQIVVNSSKNVVIHEEALVAMQIISIHRPTVFADMILPSLLDELPEQFVTDDRGETLTMQAIATILNDIVDISCHPCTRELDTGFPNGSISQYWHRNFDCFAEHMLDKIDTLILMKGQVRYATVVTAALLKGLKLFDGELNSAQIESPPSDSLNFPYESIWTRLSENCLELRKYSETKTSTKFENKCLSIKKLPNERCELDASFLHLVGNILLLISRSKLNTPKNNIVFKFYNQSLTTENIKNPENVETLLWYQQIHKPELIQDLKVCLISVYPVIGVKPVADDDKYLTKTKKYLGIGQNAGNLAVDIILSLLDADKIPCYQVRMTLLHYVQILVAKFHCSMHELRNGGKLINFIELLVKNSQNKSVQYIQLLYQIIAYLTTASFACYDRNLMQPLFSCLYDALDPMKHDQKICNLVAQCFRMILADSRILNNENYVQIRPLRKGLLLEMIKPLFAQHRFHYQLMSQNLSYHRNAKDNYLIATIGILRNIEISLILDKVNIEELVPLVLDGTNVIRDPWAQAEYIKLVCMLVAERSDYMKGHLDSIIGLMIERTHNTLEIPSDANIECRVLALEALRLVIEKFGSLLSAFQRLNLINELVIAKSDCYIGARHAAAQCSLAMFYTK